MILVRQQCHLFIQRPYYNSTWHLKLKYALRFALVISYGVYFGLSKQSAVNEKVKETETQHFTMTLSRQKRKYTLVLKHGHGSGKLES